MSTLPPFCSPRPPAHPPHRGAALPARARARHGRGRASAGPLCLWALHDAGGKRGGQRRRDHGCLRVAPRHRRAAVDGARHHRRGGGVQHGLGSQAPRGRHCGAQLPPAQPDLLAKEVGEVPVFLYGAPALLDALGRPSSTEALAGAPLIGFDRTDRLPEVLRAAGVPATVEAFVTTSENHLVLWELVKRGVGLGVMQADVGDAESGVERAIPDAPPLLTVPRWLVAHRELATSRRVRVVFDALVEALSAGQRAEGTAA